MLRMYKLFLESLFISNLFIEFNTHVKHLAFLSSSTELWQSSKCLCYLFYAAMFSSLTVNPLRRICYAFALSALVFTVTHYAPGDKNVASQCHSQNRLDMGVTFVIKMDWLLFYLYLWI